MYIIKKLNNTGDTIVEVLIAVAVLSLVLTSSFALANRSALMTRQAAERGEASKVAQTEIEQFKSAITNSAITLPNPDSLSCYDSTNSTFVDAKILKSDVDTKYNDSVVPNQCKHGVDNRYKAFIYRNPAPDSSNTYTVYVRWDSVRGSGVEKLDLVHRIYPDGAIDSTDNSIPSTAINLVPSGGGAGGGGSVSPPDCSSGTYIFCEDFEAGNLSKWDVQACSGQIKFASSPFVNGAKAASFTVTDSDVLAWSNTLNSYTCSSSNSGNARAQLVAQTIKFHNGDEFYYGFSTYFPASFPVISQWLQVSEIYGPPFNGSPAIEIGVLGSNLVFKRHYKDYSTSSTGVDRYDVPWTSSGFNKDVWNNFVLHIKLSDNPSTGFIELWHNGSQVTFSNGSQRLTYQTLYPGVSWDPTKNESGLIVNQYRDKTMGLGSVTIYHDDIRVGTTYDLVKR